MLKLHDTRQEKKPINPQAHLNSYPGKTYPCHGHQTNHIHRASGNSSGSNRSCMGNNSKQCQQLLSILARCHAKCWLVGTADGPASNCLHWSCPAFGQMQTDNEWNATVVSCCWFSWVVGLLKFVLCQDVLQFCNVNLR